MENEKILTISIAAYNVGKYIDYTLGEISQCENINDIEVLIIDDGGVDNTLDIAKKYSEKFPTVFKAVHKENGGWGSTVNYGINNALGKYFKLLDGDDYFISSELDQYINFLKESQADMIISEYSRVDSKTGDVICRISNLRDEMGIRNISIRDAVNGKGFEPQMHSVAFLTSLLRDNSIHITEHCFYTDVEYLLRTIIYAKNVDFYNDNLYYYRVSNEEQSVSVKGVQKHYREHIKVCSNMLELYTGIDSDNPVKAFVYNRLLKLLDVQYRMFAYIDLDKEKINMLISFDELLKREYQEFYNASSKKIKCIRIAIKLRCLKLFLHIYRLRYKEFEL